MVIGTRDDNVWIINLWMWNGKQEPERHQK